MMECCLCDVALGVQEVLSLVALLVEVEPVSKGKETSTRQLLFQAIENLLTDGKGMKGF